MAHDFDAQRAETQRAYREMRDEGDLPEVADVDYFLVPKADGADWRPLAEALSLEGFDCEWIEPDAEEEADGPYLVATLPDQLISAEGIWIGEEIAARAALGHGFAPDGWGLLSD
ncbi:ribonuclease E inhibitor RraB [Ponticoccus gilvus]|nr:ribonuclease E inhibitor RraB [Enemella evansiae]